MKAAHNRKDITGQRFNRLLVLDYAYTKRKKAYWRCQCDCDNIKNILGEHLKSGAIKSCGCLNIENLVGRNWNPNLTKEDRLPRRLIPG